MRTFVCPEHGSFDSEPEVRISESFYDRPVVDDRGQWPTLAGQAASAGLAFTKAQWDALEILNPSWGPTYERVKADPDLPAQSVTVGVCPECGSPVREG